MVDFGMNVQEAVDAPRIHHQWLPDTVEYERWGLSPDTLALLQGEGYHLNAVSDIGSVEAILFDPTNNVLEGASDRRRPDGGAVGR
jgi:gamma-glutamyltranspeptidase/glutathione hydrolase